MATAIKPVPTLSPKGYVTEIIAKTDSLIAHYFASDSRQSYVADGTIGNLAALVQQAGNDMALLKEKIQNSLQAYLSNYFETALVDVQDDTETNFSNRITMIVSARVTQSGEGYDVANLLSLVNGKFEKIRKLNNTGTAI